MLRPPLASALSPSSPFQCVAGALHESSATVSTSAQHLLLLLCVWLDHHLCAQVLHGALARGVPARGVLAHGVSARGEPARGVSARGVPARGVSARGRWLHARFGVLSSAMVLTEYLRSHRSAFDEPHGTTFVSHLAGSRLV